MGVRQGKDSLFFAVRPDPGAIARISACRDALRAEHGLKGKPIPPERQHITLHHLGDFQGLPEAIVRQASAVAASMHAGPFQIMLDYAASFFNPGKDRFPFFLGSASPSLELKAFQKDLSTNLKHAGLRNELRGFTPHLTLLYDALNVPKLPIEPIPWLVTEFFLVRSFVGQSRHEVLDRWPLRGL